MLIMQPSNPQLYLSSFFPLPAFLPYLLKPVHVLEGGVPPPSLPFGGGWTLSPPPAADDALEGLLKVTRVTRL